jgi:hypothetical protein
MDTSNVIYLFKKKFIDTIFFYSTLKSNFVGFHQCQLQAILPKKKGSHLKKKNEEIIKIYVLDIPKYSFIIFFFGTLMTRRGEKNDLFMDFRGVVTLSGNMF